MNQPKRFDAPTITMLVVKMIAAGFYLPEQLSRQPYRDGKGRWMAEAAQ
jgi:hypothetical protein